MKADCIKLRDYLEDVFSMPFNVQSALVAGETHYICNPVNEGDIFFSSTVYVHNNVRVIVEIEPQRHGGDMLYEMSKASPSQQKRFNDYINILKDRNAKISFLVNGSSLFSQNNWPSIWKSFSCRITKVPLTDDNDDVEELDVVSEWMKHAVCLMFSLLTVTDIVPYANMVCDPGYEEGNKMYINTTRYERNPINRELCLAHKGYKCSICKFDFREEYGLIGKKYIEVHHVVPVSQLGPGYIIDIDKDLEPVCANCHAMLHRKNPPYLPAELLEILNNEKKAKNRSLQEEKKETDNTPPILSPSEPLDKTKAGVLLVMMENFTDKCVKFLPNGKVAIGIKYTKDSMAIVKHLSEIGYILFHTRKDEGQHLYVVNGDVEIVESDELDNDIYKNVNTTDMYAVIPFETKELDSSNLHSSKKPFSPKTRYDAQFAEMVELQ